MAACCNNSRRLNQGIEARSSGPRCFSLGFSTRPILMSKQIRPVYAAALILALSACGGEQEPDVRLPYAQLIAEQPKGDAPASPVAPQPANKASTTLLPATTVVAPPVAGKSGAPATYELRVFRTRGVYGDVGTMVPVRGAGYEPLHVSVQLRNRPRHMSAVAGMQPYCPTTTRCEYLPPRKDAGPERVTVSLNEGSIARLSPVKDMIAITVRQLDVPQPVIVTVTLMVPGQDPVVQRIVYAKAEQASEVSTAKGPH